MRRTPKVIFILIALAFTSNAWSADLATAQAAYDTGDYQTALAEWQALADQGNADAQFGIGLLFGNGYGVALDDAQAAKWYQLAAEQSHPAAQCHLAVMYSNGWGVPQSDEQAFHWFKLAAENGVPEAQMDLAKLYAGGYGVAEDKVEARKWLAIAAEMGEIGAKDKRDQLNAYLSAEEIARSDQLAAAWIGSHQSLAANTPGIE